MMLKDQRILVVGVANNASIAWGIAQALIAQGARVALTYQNERTEKRVVALAEEQEPKLPTFQLDATMPETVTAVMEALDKDWGGLDGLVHSIAFAKKDDLVPGITKTSLEGWQTALHVSAYTLIELMRAAMPLFQKAGGGSVLTLTYESRVVFPSYNLMGVAKSALEATMRYAAWEGGRSNVRVNAISAGPIKTLAARGIGGFSTMFDEGEKRSPLGRNVTQEEVGNTGAFLLSPLASGITGQVIFVDAGQSIMGVAASAEGSGS